MPDQPTLHFVYNVDATLLAAVQDFLHRIREPDTYPCRLCDVTYGRFFKKRAWGRFVAGLPVRARFHMRSRFRRRFPRHAKELLPAVFVEETDGLRVLISAEEMLGIPDLDGLEKLVLRRVESLDAPA